VTTRQVIEGGTYVLANGEVGKARIAVMFDGYFAIIGSDKGAISIVCPNGRCFTGMDRKNIDWPATEALRQPREIRVGDRVRLLEWDKAFGEFALVSKKNRKAIGSVRQIADFHYRHAAVLFEDDCGWWPLSACELVTDEPTDTADLSIKELSESFAATPPFDATPLFDANAQMLSRDVTPRPPLAWNTRTPFDHFPDMQFVVTREESTS